MAAWRSALASKTNGIIPSQELVPENKEVPGEWNNEGGVRNYLWR